MLVQTGYMDDTDDAAKAYQKYEHMVLEYALDHLPNGFRKRHDYWGAVCVTDYDGENAPKTDTLYAGDSIGKIMLFDNFAALEAYTHSRLACFIEPELERLTVHRRGTSPAVQGQGL
jgi:hypothetical protein